MGALKTMSKPMERLAQTVHLSCTNTNGPNEIPHDPRHLGVPSDASKTISEAYGMFGANLAPI